MYRVSISASPTFTPFWYSLVSSPLRTFRPVRVVVAAIRFTTVSWLTSGLPRQFWVMALKSRCSILFHLLVPGGKWHTAISIPVSSASRCSSRFQSRRRKPLLPPAAAVASSRGASGEVPPAPLPPGLVAEPLQLPLPEPQAEAVAAAGVGGDQQPGGLGVERLAHRAPPAADALDGEGRGVMVRADAHPSLV